MSESRVLGDTKEGGDAGVRCICDAQTCAFQESTS